MIFPLCSWWVPLAAVLLDFCIGDPRWLPHPVRFWGRWAYIVEKICYKAGYFSGIFAWCAVVLPATAAAGVCWWLAGLWHPYAADLVAVLIITHCIAARDLAAHAARVSTALAQKSLADARYAVSMVVGRDTDQLDEEGVSRAAVEAVAESSVDGVTAPLFWAVLAGPFGAAAYRAINTLDSMWGHQDERYTAFGWAAARADDLANYIPARLTAFAIACAALLVPAGRPVQAVRCWWTEGHKHRSPNSGIPEASFAGALNLVLGGTNVYDGEIITRTIITGNINADPCSPKHIQQAIQLMIVTTLCASALFIGLSELVYLLL